MYKNQYSTTDSNQSNIETYDNPNNINDNEACGNNQIGQVIYLDNHIAAEAYNEDYNNDEDQDNDGCRALWRAVLTQALMDSATESKRTEDKLARSDAIDWYFNYNEDFNIVCQNADYKPNAIRKKAQEAIERGCRWREGPRHYNKGKLARNNSAIGTSSDTAMIFDFDRKAKGMAILRKMKPNKDVVKKKK